MTDVSIVRPGGPDLVAKTLFAWAQDPVNYLLYTSNTLIWDLVFDQVTRPMAERALAECDVLLFFGHGRDDCLVNGGNSVLDLNNVSLSGGKAIISIACRAARKLGPASVSSGCRFFIGFEREFAWVVRPGNRSALLTKNNLNVAFYGLLSGRDDNSDFHNNIVEGFSRMVDYFDGAGKKEPDHMLAKVWANWNKDYFVLLGSRGIRL